MKSIKDLLTSDNKAYIDSMAERHKYVTKEYQDYGYRIAMQLGQPEKISLYIKLAKNKPRALVEQAFSFAIDYPNAKNRGRLFMWKLKELEKEDKDKKDTGSNEASSIEESSNKKRKEINPTKAEPKDSMLPRSRKVN